MKIRLLCATLAAAVTPAWAGGDAAAEREAMIDLAWKRGCFNCHDVDKKVRGPAWVAVAERYRDDPEAFERLVVKVQQGGRGNWGDDYMSPNRRVPEADIRKLVGWLLTLEGEAEVTDGEAAK